MRGASILTVVLPAALYAQSDRTTDLLQNVGATYAAVSAYVINVEQTRSGRGLAGAGPGMDVAPPAGHRILNRILIARSGEMFHYEISNPISALTWITNGEKTWTYSPELKEYTERDAESWPTRLGPGPGLPGLDWQYVSKFRALGGMAASAKLLKDDIYARRHLRGANRIN